MRYMFRILVLGDSQLAIDFLSKSGIDNTEQTEELSRWSKTITEGKDTSDLDIDVVISDKSDFDMLIPTSDGILYFLDPNNLESFELFDMITGIITQVRREIPIIIVFFSKNGFIKIPSNYLMEYVWENYPFDCFFYSEYSKETILPVLECINEAIISGNLPINIETAWLKIPFYIDKINRLVEQENFIEAAKLAEIFMLIKKQFNKEDYIIAAEQAAWLYYKSGNLLKASDLLEGINDFEYNRFRKMYIEEMIKEASRLYKVGRFHKSAEKYEKIALWSSIEMDDIELTKKAMNGAINTWIAACEFQNAFKMIDKLDHKDQLEKLEQITDSILKATDFLIEKERFDLIKGQLYYCIDRYQRMGLFDDVKKLGNKLLKILKFLLDKQISENDPHSANLTLDEIYNIWETFNIEKENLDEIIYKIGKLFIEKGDFSIIDNLIQLIHSREIQNNLTEYKLKYEEELKNSEITEKLEQYNYLTKILIKYIEEEKRLFDLDNKKLFNFVKPMLNEHDYWNAALTIKKRADWYNRIGRFDFFNELIKYYLSILLDGLYLSKFNKDLLELDLKSRANYIPTIKGKIINTIERIIEKNNYDIRFDSELENLLKIVKNSGLYEIEKEFLTIRVKFLLDRATFLLNTTKQLENVKEILDLLKKVDLLYKDYSKDEKINYDFILKEIVERYITAGDLSSAARINEKIQQMDINSELHKKILKLEEKQSSEAIKTIQQKEYWKIKSEELELLKKQARESLMTQQSILKSRNALRRIAYQKALDAINSNEYETALNLYKKNVISMVNRRKLETAGIGAIVITLILKKTNKLEQLESILKEIDNQLGM